MLRMWSTSVDGLPHITMAVFEYAKDKSTYHSKGIWLLSQRGEEFEYLTTYGSSNYAKRSYLKDLEAQFLIFAQSPAEIHMFEEERKAIFNHCKKITNEIIMNDRTTRVSFLNRVIYRLLRNFV